MSKLIRQLSNWTEGDNWRLPELTCDIAEWHKARNLLEGSDHNSQFVKLFEELIELYATINKGLTPGAIGANLTAIIQGLLHDRRIKSAPTEKLIADDIGDMYVVLVNLAEREGLTMQECIETAWGDIKDRKGKMVDGVFVKEQDL